MSDTSSNKYANNHSSLSLGLLSENRSASNFNSIPVSEQDNLLINNKCGNKNGTNPASQPKNNKNKNNDNENLDSSITSGSESLDSDITECTSLQSYNPHDDIGDDTNDSSDQSSLKIKRQGTRLWSPKMAPQRKKIVKQFVQINIIYAFFCFIVLVFAWGTVYNTASHYNKVNILAVIQDDSTQFDDITSATNVFPTLIENTPGKWHVYNESTFKLKYGLQTSEDIDNQVIKLIYDEKYWVALNVKPNVTMNMIGSFTDKNHGIFNATDYFQIVYESGRDPAHVLKYMVPLVDEMETKFNQYCMDTYIPSAIKNITIQNESTIIIWKNVAAMMTMKFENIDYRPFYDRTLLISSQIGDVFAILLSIFQFLIYGALHGRVAPLLRKRSRILYRIIISMVTHFFASLFWCIVSAMFQVNFTLHLVVLDLSFIG